MTQHLCTKYAWDIADICRPLNRLNISYFSHAHVDNDNNFSVVCNNPQFMENYLNNKYYKVDIHAGFDKLNSHTILVDNIEFTGETKKLNTYCKEFGLNHTFVITENSKNGRDYYYFSTHLTSNAMNQVYLANQDILELFVSRFKEAMQASKKLSSIHHQKYVIDPNSEGCLIISESLASLSTDRNLILAELGNNADSLGKAKLKTIINNLNLSISQKETEVLLQLIKGSSCKQIAKDFNISFRTVEYHVNNLKQKLFAKSKSEIISKIISEVF